MFTTEVRRIIQWWRFAHGDADRGGMPPKSFVDMNYIGVGERETKNTVHSEGHNSWRTRMYVLFDTSK